MDEHMMETPQPMDSESRGQMPATYELDPDRMPPLENFDEAEDAAASAADAVTSLEAVHDVPVTVQAVLGRARIAIGALMQLKANAVIELDRRVGEPVDIFVNNRLIARGEVVLIENSLGVTLTEIVRQER
jgi:flagellar motor switch protein FliN